MPCSDGREHADAEKRKRDMDALTAILCGALLTKSVEAVHLANLWCSAHKAVDEARREALWSGAYFTAQRNADAVLDMAYQRLCRE